MECKDTDVPAPDADRPPLKSNVFAAMRGANAQLLPLFPDYLGLGCICPDVTVFRGGAGRDFGTFEHTNTVDEIVICFASNGGRMQPGQVRAGPKRHLVGAPIKDAQDPDEFYLVVVTQRQSEGDEVQRELLRFACVKCQAELVLHDFDAKPVVEPGVMPPGYELHNETTIGSATAVARLNGDPALRKCPKCGHENPVFQAEWWGWQYYRERVALARDCWRQYADVIAHDEA